MRVGVWVPCYRRWVGRDAVRAIATTAEELDFRSLWVQDHLVAPISDEKVELLPSWLEPDEYGNEEYTAVEYFGEENWWLDPFALWGFLAGTTESCELASCIVVAPYRDPIAQAKMLGTLDVLSGGRMAFGVGVGHVPTEFEALRVDYRERGRLTDEYLAVITALLTNDEASFSGPTISFDRVRPLIEPVQKPHPPFLIGGTSKRAIRRAVEVGASWLPAHVDPDNLRRGIEHLHEMSAAGGRAEPPTVSVALVWGLLAPGAEAPRSRRTFRSVAETSELLGRYAELGVDRLAIDLPNPDLGTTIAQMELLAEAVDKAGVHQ